MQPRCNHRSFHTFLFLCEDFRGIRHSVRKYHALL